MGFPAHGSGIIFEPSSPQQSHHGPKKPRHFNPMIEPQVKRQVVGLAQQHGQDKITGIVSARKVAPARGRVGQATGRSARGPDAINAVPCFRPAPRSEFRL